MVPPAAAVSFDFGQTLASMDPAMLARRLGEIGLDVPAARLEGALPGAWAAYDAAVRAGAGGHPWKLLMATLLGGAGVGEADRARAVDWLWDEQPRQNLWRRPVPGMIELCRELTAAGVRIGVLSNSEGRLAELVAEMGWSADLPLVGDSGRLGMEKPDPAMFAWMAEQLGAPPDRIVHVGDSLGADVQGALRAGLRAVWFSVLGAGSATAPDGLSHGVLVARSAAELRAALIELGLPIGGSARTLSRQ
jgi:putative hydrolase of the HAD superfamily